jgi:hypothetical protein
MQQKWNPRNAGKVPNPITAYIHITGITEMIISLFLNFTFLDFSHRFITQKCIHNVSEAGSASVLR